MMTVTMLARRCGLSRTALLYYEKQGLLGPPHRTEGNYRMYGSKDLDRLRQIGLYRKVGLSVADIRALLSRTASEAAGVLERRLRAIDEEVDALRRHQRAILNLLHQSRQFRRHEMMTKDKWVDIMRAAGFSEADMTRWHVEFEKNAPDDHQEFLEYLKIAKDDIVRIREWSRKGSHA